MIIIEDTKHGPCSTCDGKTVHLCNTSDNIRNTWGLKTCRYCGKKKVDERHICKERIQHLSHVCTWCGEVTVDPDKLCNPEEIDEAKKITWKEITLDEGDKIKHCKGCHQPVEGKGHICDPKLPYTCKFCGEEIIKTHHMCKEIIKNAKFVCNVCGRLTVNKNGVCAPSPIR